SNSITYLFISVSIQQPGSSVRSVREIGLFACTTQNEKAWLDELAHGIQDDDSHFGSPWIGIFPDDSAGPSQSDGEKQEMDPDISWIAEVCDDFAEHIEGGEMAFYAEPESDRPITREELIAFEDGLAHNAAAYSICVDTNHVSTVLAPGLRMAGQDAHHNKYDARVDGEEDLSAQYHQADGTIASSTSSPLHAADGRINEEDDMRGTEHDSASEGDVDIETNLWRSAKRIEPSQIDDAPAVRGALASKAIESTGHVSSPPRAASISNGFDARQPSTQAETSSPHPGTSLTRAIPSTTFVLKDQEVHDCRSRQGAKRGRDDDDDDVNEVAQPKATASANPTEEPNTKKTRAESAEVPHVTCPGCVGSFREDTLGRHWRDHCVMNPARGTREPLVCDVCWRMWKLGDVPLRDFSTDHSLRRHVVGKHTGEDWHVMQRKRGKKTRRSHKRSKGAST
ncbi:hypothetical protein POSPLADRAFT_1140156, partial [Postia placenta MAD-698-R-SB12]